MIRNIVVCILFCCTSVHNLTFKFKQHSNGEIGEILEYVHHKCPMITKLFDLPERTVLGNKIRGIIFGKYPDRHVSLIPEFKYVSSIHGNEVVGKELLLAFAIEMCENYLDRQPGIISLIETTRIHLIPLINVDGFETARRASYHNRNMMEGRNNMNGYDLNRNFPNLNNAAYVLENISFTYTHHLLDFAEIAQEIQPETLGLLKWIHSVPFVLSGSFHGGAAVVNYPYDLSRTEDNMYTASPDDEIFRSLAMVYSNANPQIKEACNEWGQKFPNGTTNGAAWYSLDGGMQDYNYLATNCFEVTIELDCTKFPYDQELHRLWLEHRPALYKFLLEVHTGIKGIVTDFETGEPLQDVTIHVTKLTGQEYIDIFHDVTTDINGDYYRLLVDGKYIITAVKEGYKVKRRPVLVMNHSVDKTMPGATLLNIKMKPV